jgi:hypothetical protein
LFEKKFWTRWRQEMAIVLDEMQNPASFSETHHTIDQEADGSRQWILNGMVSFPLKVKSNSSCDAHEQVNLYLYFPGVGVGRGVLIDESEPSVTLNEVVQEPDLRVSSGFKVDKVRVIPPEPIIPQAFAHLEIDLTAPTAGSYAIWLGYELRVKGRVAEAPHPVLHQP